MAASLILLLCAALCFCSVYSFSGDYENSVDNEILEECIIGEWEEWSACGTNKVCTKSRIQPRSFQKKTTTAKDQGRVEMEKMFKLKENTWRTTGRCVNAGGCAGSQARPTHVGKPDTCYKGLAGDVPCLNVDQMSFLNLHDLGYRESDGFMMGNDCWGWTDPETGDEYALMGTSGGLSFVRITDPVNPEVMAFLKTATWASPWRDVKVMDDHAFIVAEAEDHGMQVFDLNRLREMKSFEYVEADASYQGFGQCHNIVSSEERKFVYGVGSRYGNYSQLCSGGLFALDVSSPKEPRFAGCFGEDGYTHDAQCLVYNGPDYRYSGREICFAYNEDTITIVDVENKERMETISKTSYTGARYTHQGWLTEDQSVLLLDDELDETRSKTDSNQKTYIWDVSDLHNPVLKNTYISALTSIDHNQYVKGNFVYQANYQIGLRILYIDQEDYDLHEVGYFDAYPPSDEAKFKGLWSVYPYFESGTVILSSIDYGLFVVRPDYESLDEAVRHHETFAHQTRVRELLVHPPNAECPPLEETRPCHTNKAC